MSIAERLKDAKLLYDQQRFEGALLSVVVAASATSRIRFPRGSGNKNGDREAFEAFLDAEFSKIGPCPLAYNGQTYSLEQFLYKWIRCQLAHEGAIPFDIVFRCPEDPMSAEISWGCSGPAQVTMDHTMILLIAHAVASAPENACVPDELRQSFRPETVS